MSGGWRSLFAIEGDVYASSPRGLRSASASASDARGDTLPDRDTAREGPPGAGPVRSEDAEAEDLAGVLGVAVEVVAAGHAAAIESGGGVGGSEESDGEEESDQSSDHMAHGVSLLRQGPCRTPPGTLGLGLPGPRRKPRPSFIPPIFSRDFACLHTPIARPVSSPLQWNLLTRAGMSGKM